MYSMKLLSIWMWESLENLPLLLGFVVAARLWQVNLIAGLVVLLLGMGLGVFITRLVEPRLHKDQREVRWTSTLINFILFVALSIPFLYYFRADTRWINWKTDIVTGIIAGILLTWTQSLHWTGAKSRMFLHGAAMVVSIPVIMIGLRLIVNVEGWNLTLLLTLLLVLFASFIIALIDYQEMYRGSG